MFLSTSYVHSDFTGLMPIQFLIISHMQSYSSNHFFNFPRPPFHWSVHTQDTLGIFIKISYDNCNHKRAHRNSVKAAWLNRRTPIKGSTKQFRRLTVKYAYTYQLPENYSQRNLPRTSLRAFQCSQRRALARPDQPLRSPAKRTKIRRRRRCRRKSHLATLPPQRLEYQSTADTSQARRRQRERSSGFIDPPPAAALRATLHSCPSSRRPRLLSSRPRGAA